MYFSKKSNFLFKSSLFSAFLLIVFSLLIFSFAPQEILADKYGLDITEVETGGEFYKIGIESAINNIGYIMVTLAASVALAIMVYGGFLWLTAAGNQEQISKAQKVLSGGVIGLLIIYGAKSFRDFGLQMAAQGTGGTVAIAERIGTAIAPVLALTGVAFLALMVYGGILWLTAGGMEEQVSKSQKTISRAVIGIIIVLGAYALTDYVVGAIVGGTGVNVSGVNERAGGGGDGNGNGGNEESETGGNGGNEGSETGGNGGNEGSGTGDTNDPTNSNCMMCSDGVNLKQYIPAGNNCYKCVRHDTARDGKYCYGDPVDKIKCSELIIAEEEEETTTTTDAPQ